jgi:BirA family biotin operon repressor/biotin-[acetyl-CoA-carboxylase] ligase
MKVLFTMIGLPERLLQSTDSTNRVALEWSGAPHGALVRAQMQTGGRGRQGRSWNSPAGKGLYISVILFPPPGPSVARLSLAVALAAACAVEAVTRRRAYTKWPNDLLVQDADGSFRKLGGILCEARPEGEKTRVVAGIGINLNHEEADFPERPQFPATSLRLWTGKRWNVEEVLGPLLGELERVDTLLVQNRWPDLLQEINSRCAGIGEVVRVASGSASLLGVVQRIDEECRLVLQTATGEQAVVAGDVSYL